VYLPQRPKSKELEKRDNGYIGVERLYTGGQAQYLAVMPQDVGSNDSMRYNHHLNYCAASF
jgi:hypothetical protein